nr:reverse transcriptase domain-containing protein [Tanacetum cinerariifolium]
MAEQHTMSELLQAPIEGYGDVIVIPAILADNFELKITSTLKYRNVPNEAIKLMLFPFLLDEAGWIWLEKEPPRSILTWEKSEETFSEAYRFKDLLRKFPHYCFLELHQIDTFYNALTQSDQDSLNAAAGGNLLNRTPQEALTIIENKSKYRPQGDPNYRASNQMGPPGFPFSNVQNNQNYKRHNQDQGNYQASNNQGREQNFNQGNNNYQAWNFQASNNQAQVRPSNDFSNYMKINETNMRDMQNQISNMKNEFLNLMKNQNNELKNLMNNEIKNTMSSFINMQSPSGLISLPSNTIANSRGDLKAITTRSGVSYDGPTLLPTSSLPSKEVVREPEVTKDKVQPTSSGITAHIQPPVVQVPIQELDVAPKPNPKPSIPYPSRLNEQTLCEKANNQMLKFLQIFQRLHFDISFLDSLLHMSKFASTFKSLLSNKEKLFELANTSLNENCSAVLLKKFPKKLRDPGKFLIPCDFPDLYECLSLADLGANYDVDPQVPFILGRPFLRTSRALIDVYGEELTLRVNDEAITFKVEHTSRYSHNHEELVNRIDVIDVACEVYAQEVLGFSDNSKSGNPTPSLDPIITTTSPSFTPFEGGDFVLEEIKACLTSDSIPLGIDDADFDPGVDTLLLGKLLNNDPSSPLPLNELHLKNLKR